MLKEFLIARRKRQVYVTTIVHLDVHDDYVVLRNERIDEHDSRQREKAIHTRYLHAATQHKKCASSFANPSRCFPLAIALSQFRAWFQSKTYSIYILFVLRPTRYIFYIYILLSYKICTYCYCIKICF